MKPLTSKRNSLKVNFLGACSAITLITIPYTANAGWQDTQWGMKFDDAKELAEFIINKDEGKNINDFRALLIKSYTVRNISTEATLLFDEKEELAMVSVFPLDQDADCLKFSGEVSEVYGAPETHKVGVVGITDTWRDEKNGNLVTLTWSGFPAKIMIFCNLTYTKLVAPGESGGL